jgi:hypothetical protein
MAVSRSWEGEVVAEHGGPNSRGMRSANQRGRKMSETHPLPAPRVSASPVSGQRPQLARNTAVSASAAARANRVQRDGRAKTPTQTTCRTDAAFARKISEWTSLISVMAILRQERPGAGRAIGPAGLAARDGRSCTTGISRTPRR